MLQNLLSKFWPSSDPEPFQTGFLPEKDGHLVFFQQFGSPSGSPLLAFHGGPGSFSKPKHARNFNLATRRIILFDQRGCGRSLPPSATDHNTTTDLVEDARRLLDFLNLPKADICGGSWGATLALLFAETYPERVNRLLLKQVFLARRRDVAWVAAESARFYPDIMQIMMSDVPEGKTLRQHYAALMSGGDRDQQILATRLYGSYEHMIGTTNPSFATEPPSEEHINAFRLYMHFDAMDYGLRDNQLLENSHLIAGIPVLIVHNRLDMICPPEQAWELYRALPHAKLVLVPDCGHGSALLDKTFARESAAFLGDKP